MLHSVCSTCAWQFLCGWRFCTDGCFEIFEATNWGCILNPSSNLNDGLGTAPVEFCYERKDSPLFLPPPPPLYLQPYPNSTHIKSDKTHSTPPNACHSVIRNPRAPRCTFHSVCPPHPPPTPTPTLRGPGSCATGPVPVCPNNDFICTVHGVGVCNKLTKLFSPLGGPPTPQ